MGTRDDVSEHAIAKPVERLPFLAGAKSIQLAFPKYCDDMTGHGDSHVQPLC